MNNSLYTNGGYLANNPQWHDAEAPWKARRVHEFLVAHGVKPATIAEVGCGAGGVLSGVFERFGGAAVCTGFDISPQAIEIASKKSRPGLEFRCEDALQSGQRFDLVMLIDVIEHVEDYFGFLRKARALADTFVMHIPLELSLYTLLRPQNLLATRKRVGHLHFFWKEQALASLADCGYTVVASEYSLPLDSWPHDMPPEPKVRSRSLPIYKALRSACWKRNPDLAARVFGTTSLLVLAK